MLFALLYITPPVLDHSLTNFPLQYHLSSQIIPTCTMFSVLCPTLLALPLLVLSVQAISSAEASPTPTAFVSIPPLATPTASPLPPVAPFVQDFLNKLTTAVFYNFLLANGGDYQALCDAVEPENIDAIGSGGANGTAVKTEICAGANLVAANPAFEPFLVKSNQLGIPILGTALFAVQVAGNFGGGPDLAKLCTEIEADIINRLFIGYTNTAVGTEVKDYICSAAASSSSSVSVSPTPLPTPSTTNTTTPTCTSPTGFANTVIPGECAYGTSFNVTTAFAEEHLVFETTEPDITAARAGVVTRCIEECVGYRQYGRKPCLSVFVNVGKPDFPPQDRDESPRWYCKGYDAPLTLADTFQVNLPGSYENAIAVNRVCEGFSRAY